MTTLAANTSATITLDGDDVLTTDGNATFQITPTSGGKGEGYLTGHQTLGPYGQYVTIVLTSINNPITYSQASDTDAAEIARYGKDASGNITSLVSGDGTVGLSYLIGKQHTAQSKSDLDALESAALFTLDIPANTLGPNSSLRVRTLWTTPTSGATKRLRGRFGGTVLWNLDLTTHASYQLEFVLSNRNSLAAQIAQANNLSWAVALGSSVVQTFTVDFATAQQLTLTAQWPVAGAGSNNITLESVMVEHLYGA